MAPIVVIPPKSTARRTRAVKIAPSAPSCRVDKALQIQFRSLLSSSVEATIKSVTINKPIATPKPIHKKRGKTVIVPVILRTSATIPAIRLTIRPKALQPVLQFKKPIISPPLTVYAQAINIVIADGNGI